MFLLLETDWLSFPSCTDFQDSMVYLSNKLHTCIIITVLQSHEVNGSLENLFLSYLKTYNIRGISESSEFLNTNLLWKTSEKHQKAMSFQALISIGRTSEEFYKQWVFRHRTPLDELPWSLIKQ